MAPKRSVAPADVAKTQTRVLRWFSSNGRVFPWRADRDAYRTLVAEVMLQQTQTGRVGPVYDAFLKTFPTISSLARASAMDVIKAWRGLGYNKRAVSLQQAAQKIEHEFAGEVPSGVKLLKTLPGVGEYSASAIACFAFDAQVPVVDVNVTRVLGRAVMASDAPEPKALARVAAERLPVGKAYEWNQALMDIGATLCRIDTPLCARCPLKSSCAYFGKGMHASPAVSRTPKQGPFQGSARQARGNIIDALRDAAANGLTLGTLAKAMHPNGHDRDLAWLAELLTNLERDGLVAMSPGARKASPRGVVRLPT